MISRKVFLSLFLPIILIFAILNNKNDNNGSTCTVEKCSQENFMKEGLTSNKWLEEQKQRVIQLRKVCWANLKESTDALSAENLKKNRAIVQYLMVDDEHKALFCVIPKIANTNWKRVFAMLTGLVNVSDPLDITTEQIYKRLKFTYLSSKKYSVVGVRERLATYTKILFVRDPLERIVSAFRDKLESDNAFYGPVGNRIHQKYKDTKSDKSSPNTLISFPEFVRHIYHDQFVKKALLDIHWLPFYDTCFPCQIQYDNIGKYENLYEDASNILERIGAPEHIKFPPFKASPTQHVMPDYTNSLTDEELKKILKVYQFDFEMFGYDFTKYQKRN